MIVDYRMAGTEESFEYFVLCGNEAGRLGVREFAPGQFRIRLEPVNGSADSMAELLKVGDHWKQPGDGGQNRFSKVVSGAAARDVQVALALTALKAASADEDDELEWNPAITGDHWAVKLGDGVKADAKLESEDKTSVLRDVFENIGLEYPEDGDISSLLVRDLRLVAAALEIEGRRKMRKTDLVTAINLAAAATDPDDVENEDRDESDI